VNFRNLATKKRDGESNKGIFEVFKKQLPYLDQKILKVTKFKQCVHVGRQN
jgi:hypothetical protein